jgi:response regulator RpfG family c-di-GMP phosphodiesterase
MEKHKILYVDDEPTNLLLFEINLKKRFHVLTAESGKDGLEILQSHPDTALVVSDMKMPGMNGLEFIQALKEVYPDKKCFILTGYEINSEMQNALNSGLILKCLRKPMNMKDLASMMEKSIEAL